MTDTKAHAADTPDSPEVPSTRRAEADPDFAFVRDDPRYRAMVAAAEVRLAAAKSAAPPAPEAA